MSILIDPPYIDQAVFAPETVLQESAVGYPPKIRFEIVERRLDQGSTSILRANDRIFLEQDSASTQIEDSNLISEILSEKLNGIWFNANEEIFEDGMESNFSNELTKFVLKYNKPAILAIKNKIASLQQNTETASYALQTIARLNDDSNHITVIQLLSLSLSHKLISVREGAILALEIIADDTSLTTLKSAIKYEPSKYIKEELERAISSLENKGCIF